MIKAIATPHKPCYIYISTTALLMLNVSGQETFELFGERENYF